MRFQLPCVSSHEHEPLAPVRVPLPRAAAPHPRWRSSGARRTPGLVVPTPGAGWGGLEPPGAAGPPAPSSAKQQPRSRRGPSPGGGAERGGGGSPENAGRDRPARGRGSAARSALYRGAERARCSLPVAGPRAGQGRTGRRRAGRQRCVRAPSSACVTEAGRGAARASGTERGSSAAGPP